MCSKIGSARILRSVWRLVILTHSQPFPADSCRASISADGRYRDAPSFPHGTSEPCIPVVSHLYHKRLPLISYLPPCLPLVPYLPPTCFPLSPSALLGRCEGALEPCLSSTCTCLPLVSHRRLIVWGGCFWLHGSRLSGSSGPHDSTL